MSWLLWSLSILRYPSDNKLEWVVKRLDIQHTSLWDSVGSGYVSWLHKIIIYIIIILF